MVDFTDSRIQNLTPAEMLRNAKAQLYVLMVEQGAISNTSSDGVSIARAINLLRDYIKDLEAEVNANHAAGLQFDFIQDNGMGNGGCDDC